MLSKTLYTNRFAIGIAVGTLLVGDAARADDVLTRSDGIISSSLCVGGECVNNLSGGTNSFLFSDSTLVLNETNIRIKFADSSSTQDFPRNDWEIQINDSGDGGANYFGINDCGTLSDIGGCREQLVFAVEAGAPYGALYVDQFGNVGLGTTNPAMELELVGSDSPRIRFRQDTSNGFLAQTWDVGGNEALFFVSNVSQGDRIPFRIFSQASSDSLVVDSAGVGIGVTRPTELLHIRSLDGSGKLLVDVGSGEDQPAPRFIAEFRNNGAAAVQMTDISGGQSFWAFQSISTGPAAGDATFKLTNSFGPGDEFVLQADGDLFITGTLTEGSDRNAKMAIVPVDPAEILAKVTALPVSAWTYKNDTSGARHLGPMAQDFHAIFGLGERDTGISTLDSSGVALAAIKALATENEALRHENAARDKRIEDLMVLAASLAARLEDMETALE